MAQNNELNPQITLVNIGTQAATITLPGPLLRRGARLKQVALINQAALAADDTNWLDVDLQKLDGTSLAKISTKLTGGQGALVAMTALSYQASDIDLDLAAGTQLKVVVTKNGTGVPTLAQLQIDWHAR